MKLLHIFNEHVNQFIKTSKKVRTASKNSLLYMNSKFVGQVNCHALCALGIYDYIHPQGKG